MDSITLPAELRSVAEARAFVRTVSNGEVADIETVVLMVSELVTNVIRHARTEVTVTVRLGAPFRVEVHDGVAATEAFRDLVAAPCQASAKALGGRGVQVVHQLATRVGLDDDVHGGKVVWFEV